MTPPRTLIGTVIHAPVLREPRKRRLLFAILIATCAILTFFPEKYRAAVTLTPTDPASLGLSGTLGQLGAVNSVFGGQGAVEVSLKIGRSQVVRDMVARQLNLEKRLDLSPIETNRWLDHKVNIEALRGSIIQFEVKLRDAEFARQIVAAYGDAVREQLATISRNQTSYKRKILLNLVEQSSDRLAVAQSAYDSFRLKTAYSSPQSAISSIGERVPQLEGQIRAKQIELGAARRFGTDGNMRIIQINAEIEALRSQLAQTRSIAPVDSTSVGRVVKESTQLEKLRRELSLTQGLYDSYKKYLQGTAVEDLTSTATIRILEPAYVDMARQINIIPMAMALLLLALALGMEIYTIRPPLGERIEV